MNALLASPVLRSIAPKSLAGYARFRRVIDGDSALPAPMKAMFVAVAATTKGYPEMARRELARAKALGLTREQAQAAAVILCSVRGEGAALRYLDILTAEFGAGEADKDVAMPEVSVFGCVPSIATG